MAPRRMSGGEAGRTRRGASPLRGRRSGRAGASNPVVHGGRALTFVTLLPLPDCDVASPSSGTAHPPDRSGGDQVLHRVHQEPAHRVRGLRPLPAAPVPAPLQGRAQVSSPGVGCGGGGFFHLSPSPLLPALQGVGLSTSSQRSHPAPDRPGVVAMQHVPPPFPTTGQLVTRGQPSRTQSKSKASL